MLYFHHDDVGLYYFGPGHPMKPFRLSLVAGLLDAYGLWSQLEVYRPHLATSTELKVFHADEYIEFLRRVTPDTSAGYSAQMLKFGVGDFTDCPLFEGLYDFNRICVGGSLDAARRLNHGHGSVAVNWAGGLHHAKKSEASGFCYVNDVVLSILELLKYHPRVLYIDIDIHHGDGVEEAFYTTDRVMTVSFHKHGGFFPGSGALQDTGFGPGTGYAVNFPLAEGISDGLFLACFKPVIAQVMQSYRPTAVVLQCGADSLTGDRLGCFNLTLAGHSEAMRYVRSFNLPMLVLGGGGYTIRNVARCWAYETGTLLGATLPSTIPAHDYREYYRDNGYQLALRAAPDMDDANTPQALHAAATRIFEHLRSLPAAPSAEFVHVPADFGEGFSFPGYDTGPTDGLGSPGTARGVVDDATPATSPADQDDEAGDDNAGAWRAQGSSGQHAGARMQASAPLPWAGDDSDGGEEEPDGEDENEDE